MILKMPIKTSKIMFKSIKNFKKKLPSNINFHITNTYHDYSINRKMTNNLSLKNNNKKYVLDNRKYLKKKLAIKKIIYTNQTHSTKIIEHYKNPFALQGDGMILKSKIGYCVTTADCLPILFCSTDGNYFGGIHCGRRGLINGIIENLLEIIKNKGEFIFLFCPSICAEHYEVDENIFLLIKSKYFFYKKIIKKNQFGKFNLNLKLLAYYIFQSQKYTSIFIDSRCTYENKELFSYRKNQTTERFGSLIWKSN